MRYVYCDNSALEIITSNGFGLLGLFSISEIFSALFRLHVLKLNFSRFLSLSVFIVSELYLLKSIQLRPHVQVVAFNNKAPFLIRYGYMAGNRSRFSKHKMTGSSVFSLNLTYLRIPANPNYHMSIKKSQAILKCSSLRLVYSGLRKHETMFCDFSGRLSVKVFKTLNDRQSIFSVNLTNRKNPANLYYRMSIKKSQAIRKRFIVLKFGVWFTLGSENETMFWCT